MKLLYGAALTSALSRGEIIADCVDPVGACLDEIRVGLSLAGELVSGLDNIDMTTLEPRSVEKTHDLHIHPGQFYLGRSRERIRVPSNVMGQMFTRSKYARLGLEFALSSSFIFPGYGWNAPKPFVFEISSRAAPIVLEEGQVYAFLVLYELDHSILVKDNASSFPLTTGLLD